jgi:hypothetical protein
MPRLTIELTERQIDFLRERARETNLPGPEDVAARVIGSVERLRECATLPDLLREGLGSGPVIDATSAEWWRDEKAKFLAAHDAGGT